MSENGPDRIDTKTSDEGFVKFVCEALTLKVGGLGEDEQRVGKNAHTI